MKEQAEQRACEKHMVKVNDKKTWSIKAIRNILASPSGLARM
jgi:hypothetical protein